MRGAGPKKMSPCNASFKRETLLVCWAGVKYSPKKSENPIMESKLNYLLGASQGLVAARWRD